MRPARRPALEHGRAQDGAISVNQLVPKSYFEGARGLVSRGIFEHVAMDELDELEAALWWIGGLLDHLGLNIGRHGCRLAGDDRAELDRDARLAGIVGRAHAHAGPVGRPFERVIGVFGAKIVSHTHLCRVTVGVVAREH